ncbi:aldo/keto reductase [Candidatus Bathyarchaeota archaeon]|nr:aldo/keto reductase [Candidatus Bathyarchaeota archaeon]
MMKRRLGKTDLMVSIIGFGAIKLPQIDFSTSSRILNRALDLGINFIDTARAYGDSEEKIGLAVSDRRNEFYISTKSAALTYKEMKSDIETSLKKLKTDYIDIYLCHNPGRPDKYEKIMSPDGAIKALKEAKSEGVIGHVGFSCHRYHETMEKGIMSGEFEVIMVSYNMLNDELVDERILPLAKERDVGVIAMKPLAGGFLASPPLDLLKKTKIPVNAETALKFVLSNEAVATAIPGMMRLEEVEENTQIGENFTFISAEERKILLEAVESISKEFCRGCGYCQPCPQGILIPIILRQLAYYKYYGLTDWAKWRYRMVEVKADSCVKCGQCVKKCPYSLNIPEMLAEANNLLSI